MIEGLMTEAKDYFVDKMTKLEFEIEETDEHFVVISIDEKYKFWIWIGTKPEFLSLYNSIGSQNAIDLEFGEAEQEFLHDHFKGEIKKVAKELALRKLEEATEALAKLSD
jgi:hypothetical protein